MQQAVFVNGFYASELSNISDPSIVIVPISEAEKQNTDTLETYFSKAVPTQQPGFTALNTLLFQQGYLLKVNGIVQKPLHILHVATGLASDEVIHSRNLIVLAENAAISIVEQYVALNNTKNYWRNNVSEVFLLVNAQLKYYKLQCEAEQAKHTDFIAVQQQRDSVFNTFNLDFGGKFVRNDLQTKLQAVGASCELDGLYLVTDAQHIDNHTAVEHLHPHTYSQEYYKGIISEKSHAVFNGRVLVAQDAQKIKSEQKNANLLLSNEADIDTKPELEIYADDVICAHGATVGQLSENSIFYLQARGLDENLAKKLLTYGFAYEVVEEISNVSIRDFITQYLANWFFHDKWLQELVQ